MSASPMSLIPSYCVTAVLRHVCQPAMQTYHLTHIATVFSTADKDNKPWLTVYMKHPTEVWLIAFNYSCLFRECRFYFILTSVGNLGPSSFQEQLCTTVIRMAGLIRYPSPFVILNDVSTSHIELFILLAPLVETSILPAKISYKDEMSANVNFNIKEESLLT